jgi:4-amino-4-deoxy-L-arabinose transferase-like glycosyltransferase
LSLLASLLVSTAVAWALFDRGDWAASYWDVFALWLLSIALWVIPLVWPSTALSSSAIRAWWRRHRGAVGDAAALTAASLALRLVHLGSVPDVISGDEGIVGEVASSMAEHAGNMFGTMFAYGKLYFLLVSVPVGLLGRTAFAVRLPSALAGALAVGATYALGRELFGRRVGLVAGVLLAVSHTHIHMSRTAHGQAFDTLLLSLVLFALGRGLKRRDVGWLALAGVGLGAAQYVYVAARVIDVVAALLVLLLVWADREMLRENLAGLAGAFGAAWVTAVPIVVWALRRPEDYLSRVTSTGFVQTGGLRGSAEGTPAETLHLWLKQLSTAAATPVTLPVGSFYDARIPMLDIVWSVLLVLGLLLALRHLRDWRFLMLALVVLAAVVLLALGNQVRISAYRITFAMPAYAVLAGVALVSLADYGKRRFSWSPRAATVAVVLVLVVVGARNVGYYFLDHTANCRYLERDDGTAAVSLAARLIAEEEPDAAILAITEPDFNVGAFPNAQYFLKRRTRDIADETTPGPAEPDGRRFIHSAPPGSQVTELVTELQPLGDVAVIAGPSRFGELTSLVESHPGGRRVPLGRCGRVVGEVYLLPGGGGG